MMWASTISPAREDDIVSRFSSGTLSYLRGALFLLLLIVSVASADDIHAECRVTEDGKEVCQANESVARGNEETRGESMTKDRESLTPSPADSDRISVGFGWREEKPFEELKKDPEWVEMARRNNVIVDPEERRKFEAMFEVEEDEKEMDLGGSKTQQAGPEGQSFQEEKPLYTGYLERTEERKALDRYEDGGSTVYSAKECYDISESCSLLLKRNPEACGDVKMEPSDFDEKTMRSKCSASCMICTPNDSNHPSNVPHTSIGERQRNDGSPEQRNEVNKILGSMIPYMRDVVLVLPEYQNMYKECYNRHELCAFWAALGECQNNPGFMQQQCNLACRSCDKHPDYISND